MKTFSKKGFTGYLLLFLLSLTIAITGACGGGSGGGGGGDNTPSSSGGSAPSAPTGVSATAGDGLVSISWSSVSGATSYNIYWSTTSGVTKSNGIKITGVTSFHSHTGRTNSTTYYYVVTAENSYGESVESSQASATPSSNNATITGQVAGTVVAAFDAQTGAEITRVTATGSNPKTFTLTVPAGGSYKFYLIENEGTASERVYALYSDNTATTNVFNISSAVTVDLGSVGTSTGNAVPQNNPLNVSGVSSGGTNTAIPASLAGSAFSAADLQGTWNYHGLVAGDVGNTVAPRPGWYWGSYIFDANGYLTGASVVTDSMGNSSYTPVDPTPSDPYVDISLGGVVSTPSVNSTYRGIMNKGKNMVVGTATMAPGQITGVNGYSLHIALKSGGTFSQADLEGTWNWHQLWVGDDNPPWVNNSWVYGTVVIGSSGNGTVTCVAGSGGTCDPPFAVTLTIDPTTGVVSQTGSPNFRAVMSSDKSVVVGKTGGGNGVSFDLTIMQKSGGATFTQSDLTGTWNMHRLTSGDSPQWNGWTYGSGTADNSGSMTWAFVNRSNGNTSSLSTSMQLVMNAGVVTDPNRNSFHGVMSLSKDLVVATNNHNSNNGYNLWIFMK